MQIIPAPPHFSSRTPMSIKIPALPLPNYTIQKLKVSLELCNPKKLSDYIIQKSFNKKNPPEAKNDFQNIQ